MERGSSLFPLGSRTLKLNWMTKLKLEPVVEVCKAHPGLASSHRLFALQSCTRPTAPRCSGPATLWSSGPVSWATEAPRTFPKAQVRGGRYEAGEGLRQGVGLLLSLWRLAGCRQDSEGLDRQANWGPGLTGVLLSHAQPVVPQELCPGPWLPGGPWDHSSSAPPVSW